MPFICTVENCSRPNILYETTTAWLNHMRLDHARHGWTCFDSSHDEPLYFSAKEKFSHHITQDHGDIMSIEDLDAIAEDCYSTLEDDMPFDHCPFFCGEDTTQYSCDQLTSHVARHLLLLSQISLVGHDLIGNTDFVSSTDAASEAQALDSHPDNPGDILDRRTMSTDHAGIVLNDDLSDTSDHDTYTPAEHLSINALPIPWSTQLETWTEDGNWDEICRQIETRGRYDQSNDKALQSFIRCFLEKTLYEHTKDSYGGEAREKPTAEHSKSPQQPSLTQRAKSPQPLTWRKEPYKDTKDSYDGITREIPIAEHSRSPQQPSLPVVQRASSPQAVQWSEEYQRHYRLKYNFTTRMYVRGWTCAELTRFTEAWEVDWNVTSVELEYT